MPTATVSDAIPVTLSFYPTDIQDQIASSSQATSLIRKIMIGMLEHAQQRNVKEVEQFRTHFEGFNFDTPEAKDSFFLQLDGALKVTNASGFVPVTEEEMRQIGQNIIDQLPNDDMYKVLLASKDQFGYQPMNVIDLVLHILYTTRILIPLCNPVIGYIAQVHEDNYRYMTKMVQSIAANAGREGLIPLFHYLEWQAEGCRRLINGVSSMQQTIKQKEDEIAALKSDVAALKAQSSGSSAHTWEW